MEIPKIITAHYRQYIFVKEYPNYYLYEDKITHVKEAFKHSDLIQIVNQEYDDKKHISYRRFLYDNEKGLC